MSTCVNTKSPEFKNLVAKLEYAPKEIELAVHKLRMQRLAWGEEDYFPPLWKVKQEIKPAVRQSKSKVVNRELILDETDKLWLNNYMKPLVFSDMKEAFDAQDNALKFFPGNAVRVIELKDGRYKLEVAPPSWLPFNLDNNLLNEVKDFIQDREASGSILLKTIFEILGDRLPNVIVKTEERPFDWTDATGTKKKGSAVMAANDKVLIIYLPALAKYLIPNSGTSQEARSHNINKFMSTLSHELMHSITTDALDRVEKGIGTQAEIDLYNELERLRNLVSEKLGEEASGIYGLSNVHEFAAEFTVNAKLRQVMAEMKDTKKNNKVLSILQAAFEAISKLLREKYNIDISGSTLESAYQAVEQYAQYRDSIRQKEEIKAKSIADGTFMKAPNGKQTNLTEDQWLTVRTTYFKDWFGDWENDPANASKVVDENGEPKVMYHGTPWGEFEEFKQFSPNTGDRTMPGQLYFGSNKQMVRRYTRGEFNRGIQSPHIFEVFLNIRNPFYTTAQGVTLEEAIGYVDKIKDLLSVTEYNAIISKVNNSYNLDSSRLTLAKVYVDIARVFKENNDVEGFNNITKAIIKRGMGDGMFFLTREEIEGRPIYFDETTKRQVWVMNPNQIKSATNNIGTFSDDNTNIHYNPYESYEQLAESEEKLYSAEEELRHIENIENTYKERRKEYFSTRYPTPDSAQKDIDTIYSDIADILSVENGLGGKYIIRADYQKIRKLKGRKKALLEQISKYKEEVRGLKEKINEQEDELHFNVLSEEESPTQKGTKEQQQKSSVDPYVIQQAIITRQLDNLMNDNLFSASEIQDIAEQVVYWVSDHITDLQKNKGRAVENYGEQFKDVDFSSMSRAEVIRKIGAQNIINRCKEVFSAENNNFHSLRQRRKSHKITDNWNAIMTLAQNTFLEVEDFSMSIGLDGSTVDVITKLNLDADNFNDSKDEASIKEIEGNLQEHWQVETKTIDILRSMSQRVKQALRQCYKTDKDGNIDTSEWGIQRRLNVREATNSILRWTQGARSLEDMIAKLQEKQEDNPWVKQLLDRLNDKSGQETSFQSEFYSTFQKHFQPYSIVINEKGTYKSIPVNENPALTEAMTQVTTLFKIGEHPMFTSNGINKSAYEQFKQEFDIIDEFSRNVDFSNTSTKDDIATSLGFISNLLGYYVTPEMVAENLNAETFKAMYSALFYINRALSNNLDNKTYNPFDFKDKSGISGNTREFLKPITEHLEDIAISAFYDSGKMYQSYITPSYTTKLMQKFQLTGQEFDSFIENEFGQYEWFHTGDDIERGWRNSWLRLLVTDSNAREVFKHKTQLNFNKKNYMKNMTDSEYCLSLLTEYFSESDNAGGTRVPAWFRIPMLSNKPSSEFIRFYSERGSNYQEAILDGMLDIFAQELSRIQTVRMRNLDKASPRYITNFDKNGKKFCFLQSLNEYLDGKLKDTELGKLLNAKLNGDKVKSATLNALVKDALRETMRAKVKSVLRDWTSQGIVTAAQAIKNVGTTETEAIASLENFIWNDTFAAMNIMEMFITDIAYYKNAEDLQKRLAQIHAPGIRGNTHATDFSGKPVTDGISRTFYVKDFDSFVSNIVENVGIVFDRKIAQAANEQEANSYRALKESLVRPRITREDGTVIDEGGAFWNINVTDAQAYNSITSYRKKAFIFGKWSKEAEEIYKKIRDKSYTYSDLQTAFQPLKPFVYSQITKDMGVPNAPITKAKVPVQNKNSEYLLILADALLQGEDTGRPNILRAISEVMEESHYDQTTGEYKLNGIDTVQFESTVKSGLEGAIDLNPYLNMENGETMAKAAIRSHIYQIKTEQIEETDAEGNTTTRDIHTRTDAYNKDTVHEISYEDYCLQQEVPEHFKNHEQVHGSQLRYIVVSELADKTYNGENAFYEVEGRKLTAKEFKAEYEDTIAQNIAESINELTRELNLDKIGDIRARNIALSKILQREILSSPRYGVDLLLACSVDAEGKFRIPLGDPIQSKRVEQLINSIIKNRVNKQEIAGGPVVQVSNFGTSRQLNIRFKDKNGELLKTRSEFDGTDAEFKKYIEENQRGIAYFEVFAPIYTNALFSRFADRNGNINIEAIEALDPDLLKMIGYRIPTEAKYSMAPLKIVGFLPREAGDGIMLPYDITLLTGSDFDVDKEYLMRLDYDLRRNKISRSALHRILYEDLVNGQPNKLNYTTKQKLNNLIDLFLDDPFNKANLVGGTAAEGTMTMPERAYKKLLKTYVQNAYSVVKPTSGTTYRNNKIVNMTYEVLSHETSCAEMLNPGGFDPEKRMGYMINVYKDPSNKYSWETLQNMSIDELKDLSNKSKNLSFVDTQIQFYKQNSAAGSLIGIFAVSRTAHAVIEGEGYLIDVDAACQLTHPFEVADMEFGGRLMEIDVRTNTAGESVGKVLGSLVASSVDAVKDPVLNLMNINKDTANILNTLIRMGMPFEDAALFLSQSAISKALQVYTSKNITSRTSLSKVVRDRIAEIEQEDGYDKDSPIQTEPLTRDEMIKGLREDDMKIEYKVLKAFSNFSSLANSMRMPTFATRYNSIANAVGPLIIDNLMQSYQAQDLSNDSVIYNADRESVNMYDIMRAHPILDQFSRANGIASMVFGNMPANSRGFINILDVLTARDSNGKKNYLGQRLITNKRLLSKLSDFYQSYLAIAGNIVDSSHLEYAIKVFPGEFIHDNIKEKYKDNYLIQSIKYDVDRNNRTILKIDTVGLDETVKQRMQSAWLDLHKQDPELSTKLFEYCFFKGGMGFSPKAFMNLVPIQMKEMLPNYISTFRILPSVEPWTVIDQFVRNNCEDNELVPVKKVSDLDLVEIDGKFRVTNAEAVKSMRKVPYFKIENYDGTHTVFRQTFESKEVVGYEIVSPLGDNKSYLEISMDSIQGSLSSTETLDIDLTPEEISQDNTETIPEAEIDDTTDMTTEGQKETSYQMMTAAELAKLIAPEVTDKIESYKEGNEEQKSAIEIQTKNFIEERFKELNIEYNEKLIDDTFKELC